MDNKKDIFGLAHIGVFVDDIEKSIAFYTDLLGFECYQRAENPENGGVTLVAFVRNDSCVIELVQPADPGSKVAGRVNHIAMSVNDIEAVMARLKKSGVVFETEEPVLLPNVFNGVKFAMFAGPDEERLELMQML